MKTNKYIKIIVLAMSLICMTVGLAYAEFGNNTPAFNFVEQMQPGMGQFGGGQFGSQNIAETPGEVVVGTVENSAMNLEADLNNAVTFTMTDSNNQVEISESGTYIVTGSASDGNIKVKKGTTGVVLVLQDLNLTSKTGATVSVNKETEVKMIISGNVTLTDAEDPADETSSNPDVADAYDGAALKVKANAVFYMTGDGTLNINGNAKNGIKGGDDAALILDGPTINITAANDAINANYDLTILSGAVTISSKDDALHADRILTIGNEDGSGPEINIVSCYEGLEGTVVTIRGGNISVVSVDDAVNAANKDGVYNGVLAISLNMTGGNLTIQSQADGLDSNGNVNLIGGSAAITSRYNGGEAGIDYDGACYLSDEFDLNNNSGVSGPDNFGGGGGRGGRGGGWGRP